MKWQRKKLTWPKRCQNQHLLPFLPLTIRRPSFVTHSTCSLFKIVVSRIKNKKKIEKTYLWPKRRRHWCLLGPILQLAICCPSSIVLVLVLFVVVVLRWWDRWESTWRVVMGKEFEIILQVHFKLCFTWLLSPFYHYHVTRNPPRSHHDNRLNSIRGSRCRWSRAQVCLSFSIYCTTFN